MTVYKVVWPSQGHLLSCAATGSYMLEYAVRQTTYPSLGYLFAFRDIDSAIMYTRTNSYWAPSLQIFKAEADVVEQLGPIEMAPSTGRWRIEHFWAGFRAGNSIEAPEGAVYCRSITLLEEVT